MNWKDIKFTWESNIWFLMGFNKVTLRGRQIFEPRRKARKNKRHVGIERKTKRILNPTKRW